MDSGPHDVGSGYADWFDENLARGANLCIVGDSLCGNLLLVAKYPRDYRARCAQPECFTLDQQVASFKGTGGVSVAVHPTAAVDRKAGADFPHRLLDHDRAFDMCTNLRAGTRSSYCARSV